MANLFNSMLLASDSGLTVLKKAALWLDGDDPATNGTPYANAASMGVSGVTPWVNKGTKGTSFIFTQSTVGRRPVYNTNIVGSHGGVTFNGSNNVLGGNVTVGNLGINVNTPFEYYSVCVSSSAAIQFINSSNTTTGNYETVLNAGSGYGANLNGNISPIVGAANAYTNGSPHIFNTRVSGNAVGISRVDGVDGSPIANCASSTNSTIGIGERGNTTFPLAGQVLQFVMFNFNLSSAQRFALETYWAIQYGVTLP